MARTTKLEYENFAISTLDGAILAGDGTLDVQAGDAAAVFPAATNFNVRVGDDTQGYEIVLVTNIAGDTFTITRAQEGTGALPFDDATPVWLVVSKEYIEQLQRPLEIIEDGYQKNLLPEAFLLEWGSNADNWPGTSFTADSAALDNAQEYCGTYSLKVVADNLELWVCDSGIGNYNIPLIVGQKYVASMYAREAAGAGEITFRVRQSDGDNHDGAATAVDNVSWTRVYSAFTADSARCNIQVLNTHANNKTYYCDAFQLEMVDSTVTVPSAYSPPTGTRGMLQDLDVEGELTVNGDRILDSGGANGLTFDGAGNTQVDLDLTVAGDNIIDSGGASGITFDGAGSTQVDIDLNVNGDTTCGDDYTADVTKFDSMLDGISGAEASHLFRAVHPKNYIANCNFETWLAGTALIPTCWTETDGACTFAQEAATIHNSKYSMKVTTAGQPVRIDATLRVTPTQARSREFTFGCWVYTDTPANTYIVLKDDAGSTNETATQVDTWEYISTTLTVDAATATIRAYIFFDANGVVAYFDGMQVTEGPMEWAYAQGFDDEGYGCVNMSTMAWWDYTDSAPIDHADNDPTVTGFGIQWTNADTDWIAVTVVVPADYDADNNDLWVLLYYALSANQDNVTLDLKTRRNRLGAAIPGADTDYDHTVDPVNVADIWNGDATQNLRRVVYKCTETLQGGDVLNILATRVDDAVDNATLTMYGSCYMFVKR